MVSNTILLVQDGLIVITSEDISLPSTINDDEIELAVTEYGALLTVAGHEIAIPLVALTHLENTEGVNIYFYETPPYEVIAEFIGSLSLNRDAILKIKGAFEFSVYRSSP
ncbi:MAG: hypothetical protein HGB32_01170 [Geobacteraceae bacterium]|nr:hypothetical protein [Desulfuromonadaceae bacterium]NTV49264.1 hypothetical protein [Geobacteraceae bacterium]NTW78742.1 hypothetical protein [Geobacteraceae bacterium]